MGRKRKSVTEQDLRVDEDSQVEDSILTEIPDLPERPTLRVGEVADYYGVTTRTVYLWIEHGHLETVKTPMGQWRVTRESLDVCRFKKDPVSGVVVRV